MSREWYLRNPFKPGFMCQLPRMTGGHEIWYQLPQVMRTWCDTETQGAYWWEPGLAVIYFELAQDAMMFEMRWL